MLHADAGKMADLAGLGTRQVSSANRVSHRSGKAIMPVETCQVSTLRTRLLEQEMSDPSLSACEGEWVREWDEPPPPRCRHGVNSPYLPACGFPATGPHPAAFAHLRAAQCCRLQPGWAVGRLGQWRPHGAGVAVARSGSDRAGLFPLASKSGAGYLSREEHF